MHNNAQFPDPPKVCFDAVVQRWKVENTTAEVADMKPTIEQYDAIRRTANQKTRLRNSWGCFHPVSYMKIGC